MTVSRRNTLLGSLAALLGLGLFRPAAAEWGSPVVEDIEGLGNFPAAVEAYVFGYPLVTMEMTRRVMTNVAAPEGTRAPMGQLVRMRSYPDSSFRDVTAPNADTLYTTAWIDVGKEPWVLSIPDMKDRYFMFPMLDGWTNVFEVPGTRTTGTGAQVYAIARADWKGALPAGVKRYDSPTDLVWILGRIYCTGTPEDYAAVHALQDACSLVPLSAYGKPYTPPPGAVDPAIDMETAVRTQVNRLDAIAYFTLLAELLKTNPPAPADKPMVEKLARIGTVPGKEFDKGKFDVDFVRKVPQAGVDRIMLHFDLSDGDMREVNGWKYTLKTGLYGTDYVQRALVAAIGLGANRPEDAVYPVSRTNADGDSYGGSKKYVIRFPKGSAPPVRGFWSITMYDEKFFFVSNVLNRYSISPRQDLKYNKDGSLDILVQESRPAAEMESNWLPAPAGKFILMMRLYWPNEKAPTIRDGSWTPPAVQVGKG